MAETGRPARRHDRDAVAAAIGRAVGGRSPAATQASTIVLNINDNRFALNMGPGAQITASQVNVGGTQINVGADTPREGILAAVAALVSAGLAGEWNREAAAELASVIDARDDIVTPTSRKLLPAL